MEAVKQLSQLVAQPALVNAIKETAQKLGIKEPLTSGNFQQILQQAGRWMESVSEPWTHNAAPGLAPGVNATGELFSGRWSTHRLGDHAMRQLQLVYSHYSETTKLDSQLRDHLIGMTGAQAAIVFPNLSIALHAVAIASSEHDKPDSRAQWILPRVDGIRLPQSGSNGGQIRNILDASRVSTVEIGSIQDCNESDFRAGMQADQARLILVSPNALPIDLQPRQREVGYQACKENANNVVEVILNGALHDLSAIGVPHRNVADCWQSATEFIILPGDGYLGGPECGIVLGTKDAIETLSPSAEKLGFCANTSTKAALLRTLEGQSTFEKWKTLPIGMTLSTSIENMLHRAQRISNQLQLSNVVSNVEIATRPCNLGAGAWSSLRMDSVVLRLTLKAGTPSACAEQLAKSDPPIWTNIYSSHIELVMRSIEPDEDRLLVDILCQE
jgi:L-seryl-tRNA(Ser) seleniumtransferase